jgi:hypothetical protein
MSASSWRTTVGSMCFIMVLSTSAGVGSILWMVTDF